MKRNVDCNDNAKKERKRDTYTNIYGNNFFNEIQWQSDSCTVRLFSPLFKNKIITAIIYGQFCISILFYSIFFLLCQTKRLFGTEWVRTLFGACHYSNDRSTFFHVCVWLLSFFFGLLYEIASTWLFRLLSSRRYILWISFFLRLATTATATTQMYACLFVFLFITLIKIKVFSATNLNGFGSHSLHIYFNIRRIFSTYSK